jgi:hypothetical protein
MLILTSNANQFADGRLRHRAILYGRKCPLPLNVRLPLSILETYSWHQKVILLMQPRSIKIFYLIGKYQLISAQENTAGCRVVFGQEINMSASWLYPAFELNLPYFCRRSDDPSMLESSTLFYLVLEFQSHPVRTTMRHVGQIYTYQRNSRTTWSSLPTLKLIYYATSTLYETIFPPFFYSHSYDELSVGTKMGNMGNQQPLEERWHCSGQIGITKFLLIQATMVY